MVLKVLCMKSMISFLVPPFQAFFLMAKFFGHQPQWYLQSS